jgi:hypothetical protein
MARHALQQLGVARAEGLAGGTSKVARALLHADQALLERRRQLAGAQRQRGRLAVEGVDDVGAVGPASR